MRKSNNRFFNATTNQNTITLDIYDVIGADMFGFGISEGMVSDALNESPTATNVVVNINSPGGNAFTGVAIYNVLTQSDKHVAVNVVGLAASAASIIAMAGDTITMHSGSMIMIHEAQVYAMGSADDLRKMADTLDAVTASISDIYTATTSLPKDEVLNLMAAETWLNADDAVAKGFATAVSADKAAISNAYDLSKFRNAPLALTAKADPIVIDSDEQPFDHLALLKMQLALNKRK